MKLFANTKNKITKDKNGENLSYIEINEVVLVHCNIGINDCQQELKVLYRFVTNESLD